MCGQDGGTDDDILSMVFVREKKGTVQMYYQPAAFYSEFFQSEPPQKDEAWSLVISFCRLRNSQLFGEEYLINHVCRICYYWNSFLLGGREPDSEYILPKY